MAETGKTRRTDSRGGHVPRHTASAVRLMQSQATAASAADVRQLMKLDRGTKVRVLVAAVVVVVLAALVLQAGVSRGIVGTGLPHSGSTSQALTTRGFLELTVTAPEWGEDTSTPVLMRLRDAGGTERYHAMNANTRSTIEIEAGEYAVSFVSPINTDGGIYRTANEFPVTIAAGHTASASVGFDRIPPDQATRAQYDELLAATQTAVDLGDETLRGDPGHALMDRVRGTVLAAPAYTASVSAAASSSASLSTSETSYWDSYSYGWYSSAGDSSGTSQGSSDSDTADASDTASADSASDAGAQGAAEGDGAESDSQASGDGSGAGDADAGETESGTGDGGASSADDASGDMAGTAGGSAGSTSAANTAAADAAKPVATPA